MTVHLRRCLALFSCRAHACAARGLLAALLGVGALLPSAQAQTVPAPETVAPATPAVDAQGTPAPAAETVAPATPTVDAQGTPMAAPPESASPEAAPATTPRRQRPRRRLPARSLSKPARLP
ncbi:exported hypothetical protein [Burkholderiales bacterium]|nr:exported hypothetical protein [Burkholderiales bacterium]